MIRPVACGKKSSHGRDMWETNPLQAGSGKGEEEKALRFPPKACQEAKFLHFSVVPG